MNDILGPANAPGAVTERPGDTRTFGLADSWFRDCSSPTAEDGTDLQAGFLNSVIANLRALVRVNGKRNGGDIPVVYELGANDNLIAASVQQLIQRGQIQYGVDTGAANALAVSFTPAVIEYKPGLTLRVKVKNSVTGAATISVNGLYEVAIKRTNGAPLSDGDLVADGIAEFVYDGEAFQLVASHTDRIADDGGAFGYRVPYAVAGGTASAITGTYAPVTATPQAGDLLSIKLTAATTGATTIEPDGHGPYALKDSNGANLIANYGANGELLLMEFDGVAFRIMNKPPITGPNFMTPGAIGSLALSNYGPAFWDVSAGGAAPPHAVSPAFGYVNGTYVSDVRGLTATIGAFTGTWRVLSSSGPVIGDPCLVQRVA